MTPATHDTNLVRSTLRAISLLVGACVVFVGVFSVLAVVITSRAVATVQDGSNQTQTSEMKVAGKKPLSI